MRIGFELLLPVVLLLITFPASCGRRSRASGQFQALSSAPTMARGRRLGGAGR